VFIVKHVAKDLAGAEKVEEPSIDVGDYGFLGTSEWAMEDVCNSIEYNRQWIEIRTEVGP